MPSADLAIGCDGTNDVAAAVALELDLETRLTAKDQLTLNVLGQRPGEGGDEVPGDPRLIAGAGSDRDFSARLLVPRTEQRTKRQPGS